MSAAKQLPDMDALDGMADAAAEAARDGDYSAAMEQISADLQKQHDKMYQTGVDSNGDAWKQLAPRTIKKKGHGIILIETSALMDSLAGVTSDSIREIHRQELVFGTSDPKAPYHDTGTRIMPQRQPVGISEETVDKACQHVADRALELALEAIDSWPN